MMIYIIIEIIVLIIIYILALYNSFVKLNNKTKEAFSTMCKCKYEIDKKFQNKNDKKIQYRFDEISKKYSDISLLFL